MEIHIGLVMYIPNPDIEIQIRVQTIGTYSENTKYRVTLLVV